jgi:hypothetical protein
MLWVAEGIVHKTTGQLSLLKWMANRVPGHATELEAAIAEMKALVAKLPTVGSAAA